MTTRVITAAGTGMLVFALRRLVRRLRGFDDRPFSVAAFKAICKPLLHAAVRIEVAGTPPPRGAVVASNHPNYLDGPLMMAVDDRVRPVARPQSAPLVRLGLRLSGAIILGRRAGDAAGEHLRRGGLVWVAPEGHMTGERLGPFRPGPARIAAAARVAFVPVAIRYRRPDGGFTAPGPIGTVGPRLRDWRPWRRPWVQVVFGDPLWPRMADADTATVRLRKVLGTMTGTPLGDEEVEADLLPPGATPMVQ